MPNAKLIIIGEYAVFFSKIAIGISMDDFSLSAHFTSHEGDFCINSFARDKRTLQIEDIIKQKFDLYGQISLKGSVLMSAGLGSSAVFCAAIAECIGKEKHMNNLEILKFAIELEHVFHKNSSGLDVILCMQKRGIYNVNTQNLHARETQFWNKFAFLIFSVERQKTAFHLIKEALSGKMHKEIEQLAQISNELVKENISDNKVYEKINEAHQILKNMSLSNKEIDAIINFALSLGKNIACKISGAGGGGTFFIMCPQKDASAYFDRINEFIKYNNIKILQRFYFNP